MAPSLRSCVLGDESEHKRSVKKLIKGQTNAKEGHTKHVMMRRMEGDVSKSRG
jgi:hypothetical protein